MNPSPIAREYLEHGSSATCPIIDMHGHLGPFYGCYLPSSPLERMRHRLRRCGVRRIICSHHSALACDAQRGNALMQEVVHDYPDEFLGYWVVNPNDPDTTARDLRGFEQRTGFVGLKFWPDYHLVPVNSPKYAPALEFADALGLLVLVHTFGESPFDAPALLAEVGERYPRARFLMGHSGYGEWELSVAIARDLPNVYLDLTSVFQALDFAQMPGGSLMPRAPALSPHVNGLVEYMVETAGSHKVVFGSDLPWYSQHYHAGAVLFAHITDEARHDILHRNAERLLGTHLQGPAVSPADRQPAIRREEQP
ncbi:MAG TPA: amidohydrolase family protein [Isosphaeraceae bacterium]|nr:amidohydrolase family protein [Isosphaeraceae bacterium]